MIKPNAELSLTRQSQLLGVSRSSLYYRPRPDSALEADLLRRLDRIFTEHPVYGSRRLQVALAREGIEVGRRRIRRLMKKLGLWAVTPKPDTSRPHPEHKVYPYLLRGLVHRPAEPGVGHRHHLHPDAEGLSCTWSPSSTGRPGGCWPGACPTR
jgi:transposase InsO family protein